jgi:hypothetical protein
VKKKVAPPLQPFFYFPRGAGRRKLSGIIAWLRTVVHILGNTIPQKHCVILSEHSEREDPGKSNLPKALIFLTKRSALKGRTPLTRSRGVASGPTKNIIFFRG